MPPKPTATPESQERFNALCSGDTRWLAQHQENNSYQTRIPIKIKEQTKIVDVLPFAILHCPPKTIEYIFQRAKLEELQARYTLTPLLSQEWKYGTGTLPIFAASRKDPAIFTTTLAYADPMISIDTPLKGGFFNAEGSPAIKAVFTGIENREFTPEETEFLAQVMTPLSLELAPVIKLLIGGCTMSPELPALYTHPRLVALYPILRDLAPGAVPNSKFPKHKAKVVDRWLRTLATLYIKQEIERSKGSPSGRRQTL